MAGRVQRIVPRVSIAFDKLTSGTQTIYLARRIDVSQYREVTFYLRFHEGTSVNSPSSAGFVVYADGSTEEDPGAVNGIAPSFLTALGSATDIKAVSAQTMSVVAVPANAGGLLTLAITCTQGASPVTATFVVSVDMSGKE